MLFEAKMRKNVIFCNCVARVRISSNLRRGSISLYLELEYFFYISFRRWSSEYFFSSKHDLEPSSKVLVNIHIGDCSEFLLGFGLPTPENLRVPAHLEIHKYNKKKTS